MIWDECWNNDFCCHVKIIISSNVTERVILKYIEETAHTQMTLPATHIKCEITCGSHLPIPLQPLKTTPVLCQPCYCSEPCNWFTVGQKFCPPDIFRESLVICHF